MATYPQSLKRHGYKTIAAHNNAKTFWRRDQVKPKLGFDAFFSLEDMEYKGSGWPEDKALFHKALEVIEKQQGPSFYFLTTIHAHGDYDPDGDLGEKDYSHRLKESISDIKDFVQSVLKIRPDTLFLLVGDHKPGLPKYFFEAGVLSKDLFLKTGERDRDFRLVANPPQHILGDVPGFFYHPSREKSASFAHQAQNKPFYCLAPLIDEMFLNAGTPVFSFSRKNHICSNFNPENYQESSKSFPNYIYSLSLF